MIYIMILNLPTNEISLLSMSIQKQLLKNFTLQHQEMNIYTMRFQKINDTWWHCHMTCFLHISATASCVASTSHVEIAPVSSSSSPGKLSVLSKQTWTNYTYEPRKSRYACACTSHNTLCMQCTCTMCQGPGLDTVKLLV